jgi:magnesium transporter
VDRALRAYGGGVLLRGRGVRLHPLAVEDAIKAHQRPKGERYDGTLFVVLKSSCYVDETETVEFGEIHVFLGEDFVVTVRHGKASALAQVRRRLESMPELLRRGPEAVLYAIMDQVVDDYAPVAESLENDKDEIETEVFSGNTGVSRRLYELSREAIDFRQCTAPLIQNLSTLLEEDSSYQVDPEVRRYLRDVQDHALRVTEKVVSLRELVQDILSINLTLVSHSQNEEVKKLTEASVKQTEEVIKQTDEVKKISGWAAILFAPAPLIGAIYGMNFDFMPELHWSFGYPFALLLMVLASLVLYAIFMRRRWL